MTAFTKKLDYDSTPGLGSQKVVSAYVKLPASAVGDIRVPIPFKGYLADVQSFVLEAASACEIDIEKTAASGTELYTLTVSESSAIGTKDSGTVSVSGTSKHLLVIDNDYLNIEISKTADGTVNGSFMLYFIFEPADALVV